MFILTLNFPFLLIKIFKKSIHFSLSKNPYYLNLNPLNVIIFITVKLNVLNFNFMSFHQYLLIKFQLLN